MTAEELLAVLSGHYNAPNRPKGWLLAPEIAAPHSDRRADLIAAPLTHSGGNAIVGHEIKASRSDVLAELADPTKHDDWARYCHRWWLVVATPDLVDGLDIPDHWGVMAPPSGRRRRSMTIIRDAPPLSPVNTSDAWMKLARWQSWRADSAVREAAATTREHAREIAYLSRRVEELSESGHAVEVSPHLNQALELLAKIKTAMLEESIWGTTDIDVVAAAVVDAEATRRVARRQRQDITRIERAIASGVAGLADAIAQATRLGETAESAATAPVGHGDR